MTSHYKIKEIYYTIQGEGYHTGRAAIFCRFAGCNLWSGREQDRDSAICTFCDTDFIGIDGENGGSYSATELSNICYSLWPDEQDMEPFIVCTGGEPLLQMDEALIREFKRNGFITAIETNGTIIPPDNIDWVCLSPKMESIVVVNKADELKIVYPQIGLDPEDYNHVQAGHRYIQPMDGANLSENTDLCISYIMRHPAWRLSLQTHKYIGVK